MKELAPGLWQLSGFPPQGINVYLMGDVLVDAATRRAGRRILRQLKGRQVTAHALTHAHPDHQGASHEVCTALGIPFWVGERDADAAEDPRLIGERQPKTRLNRVIGRFWTGPGHPVDRRLREGDEVAGFTVLDVPGHSAGHVAFWRESDRVLVLGDVLNNMDVVTGTARPARAEVVLHARPGAQPRVDPQGRRARAERSPSSATGRRSATPRALADFAAKLPA